MTTNNFFLQSEISFSRDDICYVCVVMFVSVLRVGISVLLISLLRKLKLSSFPAWANSDSMELSVDSTVWPFVVPGRVVYEDLYLWKKRLVKPEIKRLIN